MAARRSTSLLLLVALLAAACFSCASAYVVKPEGHYGRKFLSPTTTEIEECRRRNSFLKMAPVHHQAKTDHVRTGFNKGGAVLQPTATDSFYSRIVDHQAKTQKINAGSKREGVTDIRPTVSPAVQTVSTDKSTKFESRTEHIHSQATSTDNVRTGFNRGGAVLHPTSQDTYYSRALEARVKAKSTDSLHTSFNRGGVLVHSAPKDTNYNSRTGAANLKAKSTDNLHTSVNRGGVLVHSAPKDTNDNVRTGAANLKAKTTDNLHTSFNRGGVLVHSAPKDTNSNARTAAANLKANPNDNVRTGLNGNPNGRSDTLHPSPKKVFVDNQTKPGEPRTYSGTVTANQAKTHNVYTGFNQGRAVLH